MYPSSTPSTQLCFRGWRFWSRQGSTLDLHGLLRWSHLTRLPSTEETTLVFGPQLSLWPSSSESPPSAQTP